MEGQPFHVNGTVNLSNGEGLKDYTFTGLPKDKLFIIEFVGVNAFAQPGQVLFIGLQVQTHATPGIYPIVLNGSSAFSDPTYPARLFGSQKVKLYADPNSDIVVSVARDSSSNSCRAMINLSGRIVEPPASTDPGPDDLP